MKSFKEYVKEVLSKSASIEDWIRDFIDSDAPQFKGKTKEERIKMAQAAYYAAQKKEEANPCWKDYEMIGMKKNKDGRKVPNCVPKEGKHGPEGIGHVEKDYANDFAKKKIRLSKHINKDTKDAGLEEEAPANATGPAVDMNPTGKVKKMDKRSRLHPESLYRRAKG